ncbi:hypothetical protein [Azospirillum largimobile]
MTRMMWPLPSRSQNHPLPPREREGTRAAGAGMVRGGARNPNRMVPGITPHPSHASHGPLPSPGAGEGISRSA